MANWNISTKNQYFFDRVEAYESYKAPLSNSDKMNVIGRTTISVALFEDRKPSRPTQK